LYGELHACRIDKSLNYHIYTYVRQKFFHNLPSEKWSVVLQSHKKLTRSAEIFFWKLDIRGGGHLLFR